MWTRLLRTCHNRSVASNPVPRGRLIRRASRVERRPLRHLRGARGRSVRPHRSASTLNLPVHGHRACASPVRALRASAISLFASLLGRGVAPPASHARSTRRGTPRPCGSAMPRAGISSVPQGFPVSMAIDDTARVRRPTLTSLPSATHPRSRLTLPTAPKDRSRPHNPACSGLRGAARRSPLTHVG